MKNKIKEFIEKHREIFGDGNILIEKLPWGAWNFNYKVTINDKHYVFKIYSRLRRYGYFTNKSEREYKALRFVENLRIAPRVIIFDNSKEIFKRDVLVYEYIEGSSLKKETDDIKKTAEILAKLHSMETDKIDFLEKNENSLKEQFEEIINEFKSYKRKRNKNIELLPELERFIKSLELIKAELTFKPRIVHADLVPNNIIKKEEVKLIDWQGTHVGDPAFDCWAFTSDIFNWWDWKDTLTGKQKEIFWKRYLELTEDKDIKKRIEIKEPFYYMKILLYSLNKRSDYKADRLPEEITKGREHHLEKYYKIIELCFDNLRKLIK
ncbi:aminoglycoside phosphotransferase family protein [Candidatus Woesearchaeota archaeon]|nr:aminoglycoside phosphotransferase family protein [Candidatus Woesearchaeota archaeon]